ncbi:FkbM family methyltransferase, partial [Klebsiella pneumoniae]|nr:FkbM family methyltransferase [Klebsiella pneumoniae]
VDILKLDIETSEKAVFSAGFEVWLPKVKMIIIELHDWMEPDCAKPFFEAVNKCFKSYTYSMKGENTVIVNNDIP